MWLIIVATVWLFSKTNFVPWYSRKGSVVVDFNVIIQIVTTNPKNETTIVDKKASVAQTTIKEAEDGFVKRLKVSKVIPKSKFVVVKLVLYKFFLQFWAGFDISWDSSLLQFLFPPRSMDMYEWVTTNCHCYWNVTKLQMNYLPWSGVQSRRSGNTPNFKFLLKVSLIAN